MDDIEFTPPRRRRRKKRRNGLPIVVFLLSVVLIALIVVATVGIAGRNKPNNDSLHNSTTGNSQNTTHSQNTTDPTQPSTDPTVPTAPPVELESTASFTAVGDMLMHLPCITPCKTSGDNYDFAPYFSHLADYIKSSDYAVANLETTLAGLNNGYDYHGYPNFNCPDGIVYSLQDLGFDMLLTANNHCYDTGSKGYHRTQQVLKDAGMDYIGTFASTEDLRYLVKDVNGIKVGMVCYTYEDAADPNTVAPNGITMSSADKGLINAFNMKHLDTFYAEMEQHIADMESDGAEAVVLYIHWGAEYQLKQNGTQEAIAQKMCDLGVDVIVGGHPHVIQPMDLLTSSTDPEHKTVCLYSTGNILSNQRRHLMNLNTGHTEDGILFNFSFSRYTDGTVRLEEVELVPTWINLYYSNATGRNVYDILPLDDQIEDWKTQLDLTDTSLAQAEASYERTMAIVGEGLNEVQEYLDSLPPVE